MTSRSLIVVLFLVASLANMNGISLFPFLPRIAEEFGYSIAVVGQAVTIALIGGAVIGLVAGPLADHYGQRSFIILGAMLMAVSSAGTALAESYATLLFARFLAGVASGIMLGIGFSLVTTRMDGSARRSAVGWIASGSALGAVIGPPLVTALAELGTWRTGFWFLALAPVGLALCSLRVIAPDQPRYSEPFRLSQTFSNYQALLADRRSRVLQCGMLVWSIPVMGGSGYLGAYLIQVHDFTVTGAGLGYAWAAGWLMVGPRAAILLLRHVELYPLIRITAPLMAVMITSLFWLPFGLPWILVFMMFWTLTMGMGTTLMTTAISEASQSGQSTAMMARQFTWTVGGAAGVAFGGVLISFGGYVLFGIIVGLCALSVTAIPLIVSRPVPEQAPASVELAAKGEQGGSA